MGSDRGLQGEMSKIVYKVQEIGLSAGILAGRPSKTCGVEDLRGGPPWETGSIPDLAVKTAFGGHFGRAGPWKCAVLRGKSCLEG